MPVATTETGGRRPPGERRAALLRLLEEHEGDGLAVADLAPLAGLHPNTVRAHLDVLVRAGSVSRQTDPRHVPGRPRELYRATGAAPEDRNYELLARMLADELAARSADPQGAAVAAGRRWAEHEDAPDGLPAAEPDLHTRLAPVLRLLRSHGFAPELGPDGAAIELHHCPFQELATDRPEIVCGAHLGLIQGALARIGPEVTATRIVPFVRPDLCLARLEHTTSGGVPPVESRRVRL